MSKKVLAAVLLSIFLTGCSTDVGNINGDNIEELFEDMSDSAEDGASDDAAVKNIADGAGGDETDANDIAEGASAETSNSLGDSEPSEIADEEDYKLYDELLAKISEGLKNNTLNLAALDLADYGINVDSSDDTGYGYLIKDLDNNGTKELILGENKYLEGTLVPAGGYDSLIYDIFTLKKGKLIHVVKKCKDETYYFGTKGEIIKEECGEKVKSPVNLVGTFNKFDGDKLKVIDGIRYEFVDGYKYYYSAKDPYNDHSKEIIWDEWNEIIKERCNEFVAFTRFIEPSVQYRKATVYTRMSCTGYADVGCLLDEIKEYVKFYDDNTGEINLDYNGDGGYYRFTYDDHKMYVVGLPNNTEDTLVGQGIEYEYKIEGDTLKIKDNDYEPDENFDGWLKFKKEQ